MEPFITMAFRGCQFDDTYSLQRQYADKLEIHSGLRNNDTAANATPVSLVPGATSTWRWLSNDDSSDVDYLRFSGLAGQSLTAQVIPSDPIAPTDPGVDTYLEGAQNSDGTCSTGNDFNPTTQQDLTLELLGENGSTVLAGSTSAPAGETESIASFVLPSNGSYYLRINGGSADAAQLYKLEALLENAPPTPRLQVDSTRLIAESNSAANSVADPDETVRIGVTLSNQGDFAANNVVATMTGPSGFTGFETSATLGSLAASANTELLFLFAQNGQCGDTIQLTLNLTADGGYSESLTIPLELGSVGQASLIDEGFDGGSSLPSGWSQSATGSGSAWETSTARADSPSQSAFSAGISNAGEALLFSPPMTIGTSGSTLSFRHYYDLQNRVDGAVLEASLDGGTWFDLLNSAATVVSGAYNNSIRGNVNTSLRRDEVWTGTTGGFITTEIDLPSTWTGQQVEFRWRVVHDSATAGEGWYLDTVSYISETPICDPFNPFVSLTASGSSLVENDPAATVTLTLSTPLPLVSSLTVTPDLSGTAEAADLVTAPTITIPAGQTSGQFTLEAESDTIDEGDEVLTLTIPTGDPGFTPTTPSFVTVNLSEPPVLPATVTLGGLTQIYDGEPNPASATTAPAGLTVAITYDGNPTAPTNAGSYTIAADITDPNYTGSTTGTLVISPATATITLTDLAQTYDGNPKPASPTSDPAGLSVAITYNGDTTTPTNAGSYAVVANITDPNYTGSTTDTLVIAPATATVTLTGLTQTYDSSPKPVTATTDPESLSVAIIYEGDTTAPTDSGSYAVVANISDPNYTGSTTATLAISPAAATVTLAGLAQTYDGTPKPVSPTSDPAGLAIAITYNGDTNTPTNAGSYAVAANITDPNYTGSTTGTLAISPATATVTLAGLAQTYDGNPKPVSPTSDPAGLAIAITYNGDTNAPTNAGSYALVANITDPNYTGSTTGALIISPAIAPLTLGDLTQIYDGNPKSVTATTDPESLTLAITYEGDTTAPTNAGSYTIAANITDPNYTGSTTGTLVISPAEATVTLAGLAQTFDGNPKPITATTDPESLSVTITYNGDTTAPTDAGSYTAAADITDPNYTGSTTATLVISPAEATVTLTGLTQTYDDNPKPVTATTDPESLTIAITYNGDSTAPTNAGSYTVVATVTDSNYTGSTTASLIISPATATITLTGLTQTYDGNPKPASATTEPDGLTLAITYNGDTNAPTNAGSYTVVANITDPNYTGSTTGTLVISPATATITLTGLAQTYDGNPKPASATTDPEGLTIAITYDTGNNAPTNAGSYTVTADITDPNYTGSTTATLVITPSTATITLNGLTQTYDSNPKPVTATTDPEGLTIAITYDTENNAPTNAGSYAVVATVTDPNYTGSTTATLVISPAAATITLGGLTQTYDGNPKPASATTEPDGLTLAITYNGDTNAPTNAGSYTVVANITDPNYTGSTTGTLVISPATATITLTGLAQTYDGNPKPASATTDPEGLTIAITYDTGNNAPTNAGSYTVTADITDPNYTGSTTATLVITPSTATITLNGLTQTYDSNPKPVTATTDPEGLTIAITYDTENNAPTNAGSYAVVATVTDPNYTGSTTATLVISPAAATITLGGLAQTYDGNPKPASATTDPESLSVAITYDGDTTAPTDAGSYTVTADITDPNYTGTTTATLVITPSTATITLNGLTQTYDSNPKPVTATTEPDGLTVAIIYNGDTTAPTNAGSYTVTADITDPNYTGTTTATLVITPSTATITLNGLTQTYDSNPKPVTATTEPDGLTVAIIYNGDTTAPTNAGSYTVTADITDPNYTGSTTGTLVIAPAEATLTLAGLNQTYDGTPKPTSATTDPEGLTLAITYDSDTTAPTDSGSYTVVANITDPNYTGSTTATLAISPAAATVTLAGLAQTYDGTPKPITSTTDPEAPHRRHHLRR